MDMDTLTSPILQDKVRGIMNIILIKENLLLKDLPLEIGLGSTAISTFLASKRAAGPTAMRKLLHFILRRPEYTLEDIMNDINNTKVK